jgi:hypothetical protein
MCPSKARLARLIWQPGEEATELSDEQVAKCQPEFVLRFVLAKSRKSCGCGSHIYAFSVVTNRDLQNTGDAESRV